MQRLALAVTSLLLACASCMTAEPYPFRASGTYNSAIPTVESVLGYKVGAQFTPYADLARYYRALAAASDRVRLETYGKTYENRELLLLTITSPKNLNRLDAVRASLVRLNDPRKTSLDEAERISRENPVVVWLGYNVHGDEANSAEAAMQVAYELAASQDSRVIEWLENVIVLIDPLQNPDGHERFVQFYRSTAGAQPVSDRFASEQQQRWPRGRYNHYLFDLNRDWAWQTQVETRSRIRKYLEWNPHVFVDLHETSPDNTYFFAPPAEPMHELLRPLLSKWYQIYGEGNAAAFDKKGFRYFTREVYDLFAPTYGDSWPALQGAVGMTYEQAGGGAGLALELEEGERRLTLEDRALRHFTASLATIETSSRYRTERLKDFFEFRRAAIRAGQQAPLRQFFIVPGSDPGRAFTLVQTLQRAGIEVQRATADFTAEEASNFWGDKPSAKQFGAGTYVIDLAQPSGFLARALLEREAKLDTNETYDITAWALPYAMGVETWSGRALKYAAAPVADAPAPGGVRGPQQAAAYIIDWEQGSAARLLNKLLKDDLKAYVSIKPFTHAGKEYQPGAIVLPAETNPPSLHTRIRELASEANCSIVGVGSGRMDKGPDLGSSMLRYIRKPRVAVVTNEPVSATAYGTIWHMLEQNLELPFTPINAESLKSADLTQYNVIVLPGESDEESEEGYMRVFDALKLRAWVQNGGVLIGIRSGAVWMTRNKSGLASTTYQLLDKEKDEERKKEELKKTDSQSKGKALAQDGGGPEKPSEEERKKEREEKLRRKLMTWSEREQYELSQRVPGAILRARLDNTHPLGFGLREPFAVLNVDAPMLDLTEKGENPVYFSTGKLKLSGFISDDNEKRLVHSAYAVREPLKRGHLVLFSDTPGFRGFWTGTNRLLVNAIFFGNISNPKLQENQ